MPKASCKDVELYSKRSWALLLFGLADHLLDAWTGAQACTCQCVSEYRVHHVQSLPMSTTFKDTPPAGGHFTYTCCQNLELARRFDITFWLKCCCFRKRTKTRAGRFTKACFSMEASSSESVVSFVMQHPQLRWHPFKQKACSPKGPSLAIWGGSVAGCFPSPSDPALLNIFNAFLFYGYRGTTLQEFLENRHSICPRVTEKGKRGPFGDKWGLSI
eukprot:1158839-Pelagomonas_calceolata.AAC.11